MNTPPRISFVCPLPWTQMSGSERTRFCRQCSHHVRNLSLLSAGERTALLARAREERVCGTYFVRLSGEMVTPENPLSVRERRRVRQFGVAALSAAALAVASGCMSSSDGKSPAAGARHSAAAAKTEKPPSAGKTSPAAEKQNDDDVVLLMGFIVSPRPPAH